MMNVIIFESVFGADDSFGGGAFGNRVELAAAIVGVDLRSGSASSKGQ